MKFRNLKSLAQCFSMVLLAVSLTAAPVVAQPVNEVKVMISGGFNAAYEQLVPQFEVSHGVKVVTTQGPSMGAAPQAIPNRLARGEVADVVILADSALDHLIRQDKIAPSSRTDLARSTIAMAVRQGAAMPKLETSSDLTAALLNAKSIAVSSSASGVYITNELYQKLGIERQMQEKSRTIRDEPVAKVVARGDVEIGFQQLSELKPIAGITIVGPLPADVQKVTVFSAGVVKGAPNEKAALELIRFLSSDTANQVIESTGMEPTAKKN